MKKTWKCVLAALAVSAVLGGSLVAQTDEGVVSLGKGRKPATPSPAPDSGGAVRLGSAGAASSKPASPQIQQVSGSVSSGGTSPSSPVVMSGPPAPQTIEPSGVQYSEPAGGFYGARPYGEFASAGSVGYAVTDDPRKILFRVGHRAGDIYGLNEGYTNLGAFVPYYTEANSALWYFHPRLVITDQGRGAANLGFGHRAYSHALDRVFSFSTWYDHDAGHEGTYNQVGASFAMIGRNMSFRANGNWVVSEDEHAVGQIPTGVSRLENGVVVQDVLQLTEVAYNQADLEVSMPVPFLERYGFEWGGGAYFLFGADGDDAVGAKARLEAQVTEDLWVNAILTNDDIFDTNVSINAEFTIPSGPPSRWFKRNKVRDALLASDQRYYRVATDIVSRMATVPVMVDGGAGGVTAMRLAIIDPNNPMGATGGSGTEEDPFRSLFDYTSQPDSVKDDFSIVFVKRRADGTDVNLDTTITLFDRQALLGEGMLHSLSDLGMTSITLPGATDGPAPLLTNQAVPGMNVITLANANQVSGFTIDAGGTADGIVGINIDGFRITENTIQNVNNGIRIVSDTTGPIGTNRGIIQDNIITGIIPTPTSTSSSTRGVSIEHVAGNLDLFVNWNTVSNFQGEDRNANGVLDLSEDTNMNGKLDPGEDLDFDGVLDTSEDLDMDGILDRGFGIYVSATGTATINANDPAGEADRSISQNTVTANGTGIFVGAFDSSNISLDFFENVATNSTGGDSLTTGKMALGGTDDPVAAGFRFLADGGRIDITTFRDNSATGGQGTGAIFQTLNNGTIVVSHPVIAAFSNNSFTDNALDGMFAEADTGTIMFDQIATSVFNDNGDDGLDLQTTNGGTLVVMDPLTGNTYNGNGDNGIELTGGVGGMLVVDIGSTMETASPISNNGGAGITISTVGGTVMTSLRGINASNNTGSGVVVHADGGEIFIDGIAGSVFRLNGEHGLEIIADNGGQVITPFIGTASDLLPATAGVPGGEFSNDFALNAGAGIFLGGHNDTLGSTTGLINLGSVTRNRFQMRGEDLDSDGRIDINEDTNGNGILDAGEDVDGDGHLDVAENVNGVINDGILNPSQGSEGILFDASDLRIMATLTRNSFNGRRPVFNSEDTGDLLTPGSGRGIGGTIRGTSTVGGNGGLTLKIGTTVAADANTFVDNGDAHIGITMGGNTINSIEVDNGVFDNAFDLPGTNAFGGEGIHYRLRDTSILTGFVNNSSLSNNVGDGLLIEITGNNDAGNGPTMPAAQLNSFRITDNIASGNGSTTDQNGDGVADPILSSGIKIVRTERGQFNDLLIHWNTVTNNTENGITIASSGANFLNLANMRPDTVLISENTITGNLQDGIEFTVGSDADIAARLDGNLISNNGFGEAGPGIADVGNGVEVREDIQQAKDSRSFTGHWTNNTITNNFDDGIDLSAKMGNFIVDMMEAGVYTVAPPVSGAQFPVLGELQTFGLVIGDITLNPIGTLDSDGNLISGNDADGIDITGGGSLTIANNTIVGNGTMQTLGGLLLPFHAGINIDPPELNQGINVDLSVRDPRDLPNDDFDPNRDAFRDVFIYSNLISENNGDGIEFLSQASVDAADSASSGGTGGFGNETRLMVALNEITSNLGRGIDILQRPGSGVSLAGGAKAVDLLDRSSQDPDGVSSIINAGFVSADVSIIGNHIKDNRLEGVYVVQTVDDGQNQISPSNNVLGIDGTSISNGESLRAQGQVGNINDIVRLRLDIHDNNVIANGRDVLDLPGTGIVIRVGTSGGTSSAVIGGYPAPIGDPNAGIANAANYFATDGFNAEDLDLDGVLDNDLDGDGYLDAAPVIGSGISASITENLLDGNFGHDILIHSFTATVQPETTEGTWTPPTFDDMGMLTDPGEFTVDNFQADPLARLDLIFSFNEFNSIEPNNNDRTIGTSPGNAGAPDAGAYYNNAEPVFKSREPTPMMPGGGPFGPVGGGGSRQRNATRFASRWVTGDGLAPFPPFTPENGLFKYPGMGNSTFRVRGMGNVYTDQGLGAVGLSQIFIFDMPGLSGDPDLIDAFGEARGVDMSVGPILNLGSLPWGWDILEPGTPPLPPTF